jgi:hypothetical protein
VEQEIDFNILRTKNLKGIILSQYHPILRQENTQELNHCLPQYNLHKTSSTVAQRIGTSNQKQLQMQNMKQQGKSSPSKSKSNTKDLNNSGVKDSISGIEFQKIIVRMIKNSKKTHKS